MSQTRSNRVLSSLSPGAISNRLKDLHFLSSPLALEGWMVGILCATPIVLRTILLVEHSLSWGMSDVRGYLSDLTVSALTATVLTACLRRLGQRARSIVAVSVVILWTLFHTGNYEHVKALGAPLQLTYAQYMRDGVFVAGSALSLSRLGTVSALVVLGVLGVLVASRQHAAPVPWQTRAVALLGLAFANAAWPSDAHSLAWRESDFIELLAHPSNAKASATAQRATLPQTFRSNLQADLNGQSFIAPRKGRPNVLLVVLEGITGASIPSVAKTHDVFLPADMPKLSKLAEQNLSYPTFIANQRQTNRGEFALLCGRLDYLVSGTSRMTEYAREGGDACLPRVLAENGYRTMYLQPAPLTFMMKDQFMTKAGFTDVRGHEYYTHAYARSNWGVDDKAFFEQSLVAIQELDAGSAPWFATLLTVGTHHPYTVPQSFRTGTELDKDPHGLAVRYLDDAVTTFVKQLEAAHVLDDTLLLITSDESFGVLTGFDDITQLLSFNWGFLIAKVPGEKPRVISEPHAQIDVAASVADYLGLGPGPFAGRSLFREYKQERSLVYANTYQQKIYWSAHGTTIQCDEALSNCVKHTSLGPGLFSKERTTAGAKEAEIAPLREMVALTAAHENHISLGRSPLIQDNAAVWEVGPNSQSLAFGGQYFAMKADQELVVSLDLSVAGTNAEVSLDSDIYSLLWLYEVLPPPLYDGDSLRVEYTYAPGKDLSNVEVRLNPQPLSPGTHNVILRTADLTVRPRTLAAPGGVTTQYRVERARPMQEFFLGSGVPAAEGGRGFALNPCLVRRDERQWVTSRCRPGVLVFGPYVHVKAGQRLRATFEVASETGAAQLQADLASGEGRIKLAESPVRELPSRSWVNEGFWRRITLSARAETDLDSVEARLALASVDDDAKLIVRRALLEVFPVEPSAPE